jgi:hypothetical protein
VLYWRTATGEEVDFVIEAGSMLLPIEVKATARPRVVDAKHLRTFREEYGRRCRPGLMLTPVTRSSGSRQVSSARHGGRCFEVFSRVLNTCLYYGICADRADRAEHRIR